MDGPSVSVSCVVNYKPTWICRAPGAMRARCRASTSSVSGRTPARAAGAPERRTDRARPGSNRICRSSCWSTATHTHPGAPRTAHGTGRASRRVRTTVRLQADLDQSAEPGAEQRLRPTTRGPVTSSEHGQIHRQLARGPTRPRARRFAPTRYLAGCATPVDHPTRARPYHLPLRPWPYNRAPTWRHSREESRALYGDRRRRCDNRGATRDALPRRDLGKDCIWPLIVANSMRKKYVNIYTSPAPQASAGTSSPEWSYVTVRNRS
jgi:hypothetical protein